MSCSFFFVCVVFSKLNITVDLDEIKTMVINVHLCSLQKMMGLKKTHTTLEGEVM